MIQIRIDADNCKKYSDLSMFKISEEVLLIGGLTEESSEFFTSDYLDRLKRGKKVYSCSDSRGDFKLVLEECPTDNLPKVLVRATFTEILTDRQKLDIFNLGGGSLMTLARIYAYGDIELQDAINEAVSTIKKHKKF
jgi:hypothetical protein